MEQDLTKDSNSSEDANGIKFSLQQISNLDIFKQNPKLFIKLKICVDDLNFYEAHQAYKTLNFRCLSGDLLDDSLKLLFNGVCFFAEHRQHDCSFDLAKTFLDTLKKRTNKIGEQDTLNKIVCIHKLLRNEERIEFTVNVFKILSSAQNEARSGSAEAKIEKEIIFSKIHFEFANNLWSEKNYEIARYHFLHSSEGKACAKMLIEFHLAHGFPSEIDLFIAQTVFQYLCKKNTKAAYDAFTTYIQEHPKLQINAAINYPLLNYIYFLLKIVESGKTAAFKSICESYKKELNRDPSYQDYLDRIGKLYFKIKSKKSENDNPLNNILRMFFSSDNAEQQASENSEASDEENLFYDFDDNENLD